MKLIQTCVLFFGLLLMLTGCKSNDQTAVHETNLPSKAILPEASNRVSRVNQENNEIITDNSSTSEPAGANGIRNGLYRDYEGGYNEVFYKNNKWHGQRIVYQKDKNVLAIFYYSNGIPVGIHYEWRNGNKVSEVYYKDGKRIKAQYWYENGQKKEILRYTEGVVHGSYKEWYSNGDLDEVGRYKNGKKTGKWYRWEENGFHKIEQYKDGKRDGTSRGWYESGQPGYVEYYNNGTKIGAWTSWYENGQKVMEEKYLNGKKQGEWRCWNEDGSLKETVRYNEGKKIPGSISAEDQQPFGCLR